jgi:putative FmdB family regulatory protein
LLEIPGGYPHARLRIILLTRLTVPIYEYACEACGHTLEKLQKMSDAPLTICPQCGEPRLQKQVSAAGFRLKGGGWYVTDFKDNNKKKATGDEKKSSGSKSDGKGGDKKGSDTKPTTSNKD